MNHFDLISGSLIRCSSLLIRARSGLPHLHNRVAPRPADRDSRAEAEQGPLALLAADGQRYRLGDATGKVLSKMTLPRIELPRSVKDNRTFCPVTMGYVGVERCDRCRFREEPAYDESGRLTEFVCTPSRAAWLSGISY
ncbi:MAG: hypothetical protein ACLFWH_01085 [Actinomycetota bacterium]